jgi:hypothetical protein
MTWSVFLQIFVLALLGLVHAPRVILCFKKRRTKKKISGLSISEESFLLSSGKGFCKSTCLVLASSTVYLVGSTCHEIDFSFPEVLNFYLINLMYFVNYYRPVIDQNFYYAGLKFTGPTFACAMSNILPAMTFVMAVIFRYYVPSII